MENITSDEIRKHFPGASASVVAANSKGIPPADTGNPRPYPIVQKQQDADTPKPQGDGESNQVGQLEASVAGDDCAENEAHDAYNETSLPGGDGADDKQFRVTITVRFSNRRRTDLSGKLDTILDAIIRSRRRCLGDDTGDRHKGGTGGRGQRGSDDNNSKAVRKYGRVPF
jgi:hypothetical protein